MQRTPYADVNEILAGLPAQMQAILGEKLVGLYLYGSLVAGDFDAGISDMDLLAALTADLNEREFSHLDAMHQAIVAAHPRWNDRIEIAYLSLDGLKTFRTQTSPLGIISPGEPFHIVQAGADWLINWYMVREIGRTLYGPAPTALIPPMAGEEFIQTVKEHAQAWQGRITGYSQRRKSQAYAILTLCRALYTCRHGAQVSKRQAALWAIETYPQWASLIT
ncbi:MAG: DUF4111 domain-containing protein, partial [Caldilineaceae bacterium]|nr:DUF4111 domain-containing protein [Caldilineaceae bacterium]